MMTPSSRSLCRNRNAERGNVLFYILIAVGLLASLSYAVTRSNSGGSVTALDEQRRELLATEIIEYGNVLANGVSQLRLRGCGEDELSFESAPFDGTDSDYANASAPADYFCHLFHPDGGGIAEQDFSENMNQVSAFTDIWYSAANYVDDVGTTCSGAACKELLLLVRMDDTNSNSQTLCMELNNLLGITNPSSAPPVDADIADTPRYTGSFSATDNSIGVTTATEVSGKMAACIQEDSTDDYWFYSVLMAR